MASRTETTTVTETFQDDLKLSPEVVSHKDVKYDKPRPPLEIVWKNVVLIGGLHVAALYGIYLIPQAKISTLIWGAYIFLQSSSEVKTPVHLGNALEKGG